MAEVTGELGGQPILLENAATEATLYALLQATLATNSNKSQAAKIQQAYEEALKRTTKSQQLHLEQNNKHRQAIAAEIERRDQLNKRIEEEKEKRKKFMQGLSELGGILQGIGNIIGKTLNFALSQATPKVTDFTDALSGIPIIGPIIGAVGKAMQEQIDTFRALSQVGADFGSGIDTMRMMAGRAGLPLEVFTKAITENSSALAQLGGNTTAGARIFTAVNKSMQGPFQQGLARLGFSMEETADLTAGYLAIQTRLGRAQSMSQAELNEGNKEYLLQVDMLARVHGMTRKEAEKALAAQMEDKRLKLFYRQIGGLTGPTSLFMTGLSKANKDYADAMADLMLNNGVPSASNDLAMDIARNSPALVRLSMQLRKGTVSQEEANKVIREESIRMGRLVDASGATTAQMLNLNSKTGLAASTMIGLDKFGLKAADAADAQAQALQDATKDQLNFDKSLLALRESMYKALVPLMDYVRGNINKLVGYLLDFVKEFVRIMEGPGGIEAALKNAVKKVGELLAPAFKEMLTAMLTNPWVIGGLVAGFAILFGSTIVQMALARQIMKSMNKGPGGVPDVPGGPGTAGKVGKIVKGLSIAAIAGYTIDAGVGAFGVGKGDAPDLEQDEKNWNKATFGEKAQSAIPRSIENIGDFIGLSNMAAQAKKDRIAAETAYLANKKPASTVASTSASPEQVASASTPDAMKARAASIAQIKELTTALNQLDYNKLIIPETANKNIEINTGKMRLLRGEVNALTTSFKNLNDVGLSKITKGINALSGEFKIFNDGFSIFKKKFEELDRTVERGLLSNLEDQLKTLNTSASGIATNTLNTADTLSKRVIRTKAS
jgi:hypothetical protein